TRGLMELIALNIGYDLGIIPRDAFTMLVIMAVVTNLMTGPLLRFLLPRMGHVVPRGIEA
ncbi:MAG TPA: potassium transporter Kef, partial [Gammaproteobacteria bacterium]|nr:potassium transporter Kef [Gammaproteobacteria bacterium]